MFMWNRYKIAKVVYKFLKIYTNFMRLIDKLIFYNQISL